MKENSIAKKLIFFMYCPDDFNDKVKQIYSIHLKCLKYYWDIFNIHQFILAGNNHQKYIDFIKTILGNVNIDFIKVSNNEQYREGKYYYDIVLPSLEKDNCLTFFCHSKGMADLFNKSKVKNNKYEPILNWILIMYFMNLQFIKDVDNKLIKDKYICYGTLFLMSRQLRSRVCNLWIYSGSFQWINNQKFINYIKESNQYNKYKNQNLNYYIAEDFLGNYIPVELAATHSMIKETNLRDDYNFAYEHLSKLENIEVLQEFNKFKQKIENE